MNLRETQRTSKLNIDSLKINANDIVLVFYEKVLRHFWMIAIVTRVLPNRDSKNTYYDTNQTDKARDKNIASPSPALL